MKKILVTAAVIGTAMIGSAMAKDKCDVPKAEWQPKEMLQQKLEGQGWKIRSIGKEDGCWEAYAIDAEGKKVEAYFDPRSLEQMK